jgi:opacity protein-like surface antigen
MKNLFIIIAVFISSASFAQRSFWSFNYQMSFSSGEQSDFIADPSFRGWGVDGRGFITQDVSVGGSFSWEVFNQIYRDLPPQPVATGQDNVAGLISGVQYRYLNTLPILANAHYYLGSDGEMRPYFGIGIGTSYIEQKTEIGLVSITENGWGFAVQPEIGLMIPFGLTGFGANLSGRFRYTTKTSETIPISFFTLAVGIGFMN